MVEILLQAGANPNLSELHFPTPVMLAALKGRSEIIKDLLIPLGVDINELVDDIQYKHYIPAERYTPLIMALQSGDAETVRFLIEKGARNPLKGSLQFRCLLDAICLSPEKPEIVQMLLDINNSKNEYEFVLALAAANSQINVLRQVLETGKKVGMDIDSRARGCPSALGYAVKSRSIEMVTLLLQHGANPNNSAADDWPLIEYAKDRAMVSPFAVWC